MLAAVSLWLGRILDVSLRCPGFPWNRRRISCKGKRVAQRRRDGQPRRVL